MLRRPLKIRIAGREGSLGLASLLARARIDGLVLAEPGETADLVALAPEGEKPEMPQGTAPAGIAAHLSERELEILGYLADGWSNAEIASVLRIGVRTVRFHLANVYSALGVKRRGEAVREALRLGLISFDF